MVSTLHINEKSPVVGVENHYLYCQSPRVWRFGRVRDKNLDLDSTVSSRSALQGVVRVHLLAADKLLAKDTYMMGLVKGKSDPYATIRVGNRTYKSQTVKENLEPVWNEVYEVEHLQLLVLKFVLSDKKSLCLNTLLSSYGTASAPAFGFNAEPSGSYICYSLVPVPLILIAV